MLAFFFKVYLFLRGWPAADVPKEQNKKKNKNLAIHCKTKVRDTLHQSTSAALLLVSLHTESQVCSHYEPVMMFSQWGASFAFQVHQHPPCFFSRASQGNIRNQCKFTRQWYLHNLLVLRASFFQLQKIS